MINAKSLAGVHTHTHTDSLNAIKVALFSVEKINIANNKANRTYLR